MNSEQNYKPTYSLWTAHTQLKTLPLITQKHKKYFECLVIAVAIAE